MSKILYFVRGRSGSRSLSRVCPSLAAAARPGPGARGPRRSETEQTAETQAETGGRGIRGHGGRSVGDARLLLTSRRHRTLRAQHWSLHTGSGTTSRKTQHTHLAYLLLLVCSHAASGAVDAGASGAVGTVGAVRVGATATAAAAAADAAAAAAAAASAAGNGIFCIQVLS